MPHTPARTGERKRARSPEDKDQRRAQLVAAATHLFAQGDYDSVTIARVADMAGVAKGTAYLYFATKETLFLELVRAELLAWMEVFEKKLARLRGHPPEVAVAKALARTLNERPVLRRLLVLLHTVIERNLAETTVHAFKCFLRDLLARASTAMVKAVPGLREDDAGLLMLQTHALVISASQLSEPPPLVAKILSQDASLHGMYIAFEPFVAQTLQTLLRGLLSDTHAPVRRVS